MNLRTQVAKTLRALRKEAGLTQEVLASKVSYSEAAISFMETDQRSIPLEAIESFAKALDVSISITITSSRDGKNIVRSINV
jgi:transcriptional regulator with XRE-family HTH domain